MGTYTQLNYHVVFATKFRRPSIAESIQERVYEYIGGTVRALNGKTIAIGGIEDHVHLLVNLPPSKPVSNCLRDIKANSSRWINQLTGRRRGHFAWQKGFGSFTVSYSQMDAVELYIRNQREHHRTRSFKEEFTDLLTRHSVEFRPEYLFEQEYVG